ncbi:MAG: CoA pyrophosphatase [Geminicoccaceae bacterium]|nr:CoA pyrophosphatase [Geminicoccaceae bacterium]MCX8101879.1 CoA pyrophosphatase [Geminicoccaceae bacterium]MDW8370442.1 CoA pyrophosphatase [Geminicoccaceae bacterium]
MAEPLFASLDPARLRARLEAARDRPVPNPSDAAPAGELAGPATPAAVLIGLVGRPDGPRLLLTQRTAHLKDHAGQISFPGGRIEPEDPDPIGAALREAEEEIGLAPSRVEVLGRLASYRTRTGFLIHPVVGWIEPPLEVRPDPFEVAEVFEVPLAFALDPRNHRRDFYLRDGLRREFWVVPFEDRYIWGATAGMIVNLAHLLAE